MRAAGFPDAGRHVGVIAESGPTFLNIRTGDVDFHGINGGVIKYSRCLRILINCGTRKIRDESSLAKIQIRQNLIDNVAAAWILQAYGVNKPLLRLPQSMRFVTKARLQRRALEADGACISIAKALDPCVLFAESHAARQQNNLQ